MKNALFVGLLLVPMLTQAQEPIDIHVVDGYVVGSRLQSDVLDRTDCR